MYNVTISPMQSHISGAETRQFSSWIKAYAYFDEVCTNKQYRTKDPDEVREGESLEAGGLGHDYLIELVAS